MTQEVPLSVALVAGGLATLNPCGFPLLPAFLSFYVGAEERRLPRAPGRIAQGLLVGLLVTAGFIGVFAAVGLPITYGVGAVADAVPWAGLAIGVLLALLGLLALSGRRVSLRMPNPIRVAHERRLSTMLLFGAAYAVASLGCTLPLFLALVGASLGAGGAEESLGVFAAYAVGMAVVLMALSLGAALAREGLARGLRRLLPHMSRIAGGLLVIAGGYLSYYWLRLELGPSATLADDPVVGFVTRFTGRVQALAQDDGRAIVIAAASVVAIALVVALWQRSRARALGKGRRAPVSVEGD
jgi:cytochrome c-type biogenesis protein